MAQPIKTYKEFYPFYLSEHENPVNRLLHFIGTFLVFICLFMSIYTGKYFYIILIPVVGYGFAWIGHFVFEKNKPATFQYPFWSLISDFKMFFQIIGGKVSINPSKPKH